MNNLPMTGDESPDVLANDEELRERFKLHTQRILNALFVLCVGFGALVGALLAVLAGILWAQLALLWAASVVVYLALVRRARAEERRDEIWREYLQRAFRGPQP